MTARDVILKGLEKAEELGLLATIGQVISAVLSGKPDQAERLARNGALAAAAKLAARERIRGTR